MRVVIEIEDGEQTTVTTSPSGVTVARSPDSDPDDGSDATASSPSPDAVDQSAGTAPTADITPDQPETSSDPAAHMVDDVEAMDAGAAPAADSAPDEPEVFDPTTEDAVDEAAIDPDSDSAIDAGTAPDSHDAFDPESGPESDVDFPGDGAAVDAGSAPGDEADPSDAEDTGIGDLEGVPATDAGAAPADLVSEVVSTTVEEPDDLTAISGLGPSSEAALIAAGITTYAALAARSDEELRQIMSDAGLAVSVESWATQAESLG